MDHKLKVKSLLTIFIFICGIFSTFLIFPQNAEASDTGYVGEFWNNPLGPGGQSPSFPGGSPAYTSTSSQINFNWGMGSPNGAIQSEDFVARWTRTAYFAAGTYHFSIGSDDGNRVYVDNQLIIDSWVDQGANPADEADYALTAGMHTIKVEYYENGSVAEVYFSMQNTTDGDGDGVDNTIEAAGPNSGDANNDGQADVNQAYVASFPNPVTGQYTALELGNTCTIISASVSAESTNSADIAFDYGSGLMRFTADCGSAGATTQVTHYYFGSDSSAKSARKFNSTNNTYQAISGYAISQVTIGGVSTAKMTYPVTDGGNLDEDGIANGTIVDPAGLASAVIIPPNTGLGR